MRPLTRLPVTSALAGAVLAIAASVPSQAGAQGATVTQPVRAVSRRAARAFASCPGARAARSDSAVLAADLVSAHTGWVLTRTALLRTTDGGATWRCVTPPAAARALLGGGPLLAVRHAERAWLAYTGSGRAVTVSSTANGGRTWRNAIVPPPEGTSALSFADTAHKYPLALAIGPRGNAYLLTTPGAAAFQEPVALYRLASGSAVWRQVAVSNPRSASPPTLSDKTGLRVTARAGAWMTGYGAGVGTYVYRSSDGGRTWRHVQLPLPPGYDVSGGAVDPMAPAFFGVEGVLPVVLEGRRLRVVVERTTDGGRSWRLGVIVAEAQLVPPAVSFLSPRVGYLVGRRGLLVTHDGGVHWRAVGGRLPPGVTALWFVSRQCGWAVAGAKLWATHDGGRAWQPLALIAAPWHPRPPRPTATASPSRKASRAAPSGTEACRASLLPSRSPEFGLDPRPPRPQRRDRPLRPGPGRAT